MTSSPGLRGWSRLQSESSAVECYSRRQTPESKIMLPPYTMCRRASNNDSIARLQTSKKEQLSRRSVRADDCSTPTVW